MNFISIIRIQNYIYTPKLKSIGTKLRAKQKIKASQPFGLEDSAIELQWGLPNAQS